MVLKAPPFRFTVKQYDQMIENGILTEDDRVELIRGEIVPKMPSNPPHAAIIKRLIRLLSPQIQGRAILDSQNAVRMADSEPEPDIAVLGARADDYESSHPEARDALILIEIADSSLEKDSDEKARLYAENGIPEYWIVNVNDRAIIVHRTPRADGTWASITTHTRGDTLDIATLSGVTIPVADILP